MQTQLPAKREYDLIVIGSGGGGFAAAVAGGLRGWSVLVIEKSEVFGGTTAYSGGAIWSPGNEVLKKYGVDDSVEAGRRYMRAIVGGDVADSRIDAYLQRGVEMVKEFNQRTRWIRWTWLKGYPDYYPETDGGSVTGRGIEPLELDGRQLGAMRAQMRGSFFDTKGFAITIKDYHDITMIARNLSGFLAAARVMGRRLISSLTGREYLFQGQALIGRLRLALADVGGELALGTPLTGLTQDSNGRVTGVVVQSNGSKVELTARRGVVLATGGFSKSQHLRETYLSQPTHVDWSPAPKELTGDAIAIGRDVGASIASMDKYWGQPVVLVPNASGPPIPILIVPERAIPGTIMVDGGGARYCNESAAYNVVADAMNKHHATGVPAIPSWLIFDERAKRRYILFGALPWDKFPDEMVMNGFISKADSLDGLESLIELPQGRLGETIKRFNALAVQGKDMDFGRGNSAYDRYYGDPSLPNPVLAPLTEPPYYAVKVYPGDIGTKGGLQTDEHARVLRSDGSAILGLYATGNCAASVTGESYPGPGATIGPSMIFGYAAIRHIEYESENRKAPDKVLDTVI